GVQQQLRVLGRSQLVVERNEHPAAVEDRVRRDQPLRLVGHDDGGAVARPETVLLQRGRERQGGFFELAVAQAGFFAVAVGLDQADLVGPAVERVLQRRAQAGILGEIKHYLNYEVL